jgi:hypothetical protein
MRRTRNWIAHIVELGDSLLCSFFGNINQQSEYSSLRSVEMGLFSGIDSIFDLAEMV